MVAPRRVGGNIGGGVPGRQFMPWGWPNCRRIMPRRRAGFVSAAEAGDTEPAPERWDRYTLSGPAWRKMRKRRPNGCASPPRLAIRPSQVDLANLILEGGGEAEDAGGRSRLVSRRPPPLAISSRPSISAYALQRASGLDQDDAGRHSGCAAPPRALPEAQYMPTRSCSPMGAAWRATLIEARAWFAKAPTPECRTRRSRSPK